MISTESKREPVLVKAPADEVLSMISISITR